MATSTSMPQSERLIDDQGLKKGNSDQEAKPLRINWLQTGILTIVPAFAFYGLCTTSWTLPTLLTAVIMYFLTGLGITAGYHRLWSHRCYSAAWIVRLILILCGGAAFEGSCKWWSRNHRAHHRYNDTDKDPYAVHNGFWWAHVGWMIFKQDYHQCGKVDIQDLNADSMVRWQHKYYGPIALGVGIAFPTLLCGLLWGDFRGGFFFASMLRIFFVHHATFFVNSLAHYHGFSTYSDLQSAKDSWVTAVLTLGEGYHNYHHEFPSDYRNGIKFYHYDPTKWLIRSLSFLGLTYNLKQYSKEDAQKAQLQTRQRQLMVLNASNEYGSNFETLPNMTWAAFRADCAEGRKLIVIGEFVHDVSKFVDEHPGGRQTLLNFVGTDSTRYFNGEVGTPQLHKHTKLGRSLLKPLRVANITERPGEINHHHQH